MPRTITRRLELSPEFRDLDMMGVVHNCVYFEWFERGRLQIMNDILPIDEAVKLNIAIPVLENSCKYETPIKWGDKLVLITRHRIFESYSGRLEFTHEIINAKTGARHAYGECLCSIMDMSTFRLVRETAPQIWEKYSQLK